MKSKLTIYFDEPFWVGVFEELDGDKLSACRVVFGAEPTDAQIYAFILKRYYHLRFSAPVKAEIKQKADNPKRRQRNAHKQLEKSGVGTSHSRRCKSSMKQIKPSESKGHASKEKPKSSGYLS